MPIDLFIGHFFSTDPISSEDGFELCSYLRRIDLKTDSYRTKDNKLVRILRITVVYDRRNFETFTENMCLREDYFKRSSGSRIPNSWTYSTPNMNYKFELDLNPDKRTKWRAVSARYYFWQLLVNYGEMVLIHEEIGSMYRGARSDSIMYFRFDEGEPEDDFEVLFYVK